MRRLLLAIVFLLPFFVKAQSSVPEIGSKKYLDYKQGYKSIHLSSPVSSLNGKYLVKLSQKPEADGTCLYTYNEPSVLNFGNGVELKRVQLKSYNDQISSIYLFFDQSDGSKIKEVFITAYGKEKQSNSFIDKYLWTGTLAEVYLTYEDSSLSAVIYSDVILNMLIDANKDKSASKAATDL